MGVQTVREEQAISRLTTRLVEKYTDTHSEAEIETAVGAARKRFEGHRVRDFVPILIERIVRRELEPEQQPVATAKPSAATPPSRSPMPDIAAMMKRIPLPTNVRPAQLLAAAAVLVIGIVVVTIAMQPDSKPAAPPPAAAIATLHGVVGSEKMPFFTDPRVVQALARDGVKVAVDPAGSRQIATSVDLSHYDFAFPSSAPAAERIQRARNITTKYTPFSSPMAIATFKPIADLLAKAGVVKQEGTTTTLDIARYLDLVNNGESWDQLADNAIYPVRKNILISTTDPNTSNSAAMYIAVASFVANGNAIVRGATAEQFVLPQLSKLFLGQGYTENTSEGPFKQYLADGMGPNPMAWIYEAQYVDATVQGKIKPEMVLMYPSPTVLSQHTLIPLTPAGDRIGQLLSTDVELQRLAAEHGFRTNDPAQFASVAAAHNVPVPTNLIDVVDAPSYDTLEHLVRGVDKTYH